MLCSLLYYLCSLLTAWHWQAGALFFDSKDKLQERIGVIVVSMRYDVWPDCESGASVNSSASAASERSQLPPVAKIDAFRTFRCDSSRLMPDVIEARRVFVYRRFLMLFDSVRRSVVFLDSVPTGLNHSVRGWRDWLRRSRANPIGAACTELVATALAISAALSVTPALPSLARNLSSARVARFCAASAPMRRAAPNSASGCCW
jgi:hypothetical protein